MPLGQAHQVWKFLCTFSAPSWSFCPGIFNCTPMLPSGTWTFLFNFHSGICEGTLTGKERKEKKEMQDNGKRAITKLGGSVLLP